MTHQGPYAVFGTGALGKAVMRELLARGRRVRMASRHGYARVPAGVEVVKGDASSAIFARELCQGASVVFQCAQPGYTQWPRAFPALQAGIVEGAAANNARLIVGDNLYMYGEVDGPLREDSPSTATTRKGRTRARMAAALLEAHASGKVRVAIGRGSDFFGPEVLGSQVGARVFAAVVAGKTADAAGNVDLPHTYTFIDDFAKALVTLGEREEALGHIWHVPNAATVTTRQFLAMAFEEAGHAPRLRATSRTMMRIVGLFIPEARETVEMMYEFEKPFIVDHGKYARAFRDHATPLREAIRRTVQWYRQRSK